MPLLHSLHCVSTRKSFSQLIVFIILGLPWTWAQAQSTWYVNDNVLSGDVFTTAIGNDANPGTSVAPFATISKAVAQASSGDVILVDAGNYSDNVVVSKRLTIRGAGQGNTSGNTVLTSALSSKPTVTYLSGGSSTSQRQTLASIRITGATGGTGNNNSGILITGSAGMSWFTFDQITSTGNSGHGLAANFAAPTLVLSHVGIHGSSFASNGGYGIRTASHIVDSLTISNCSILNNGSNGIALNPSENVIAYSGRIALSQVEFEGNSSIADFFAFRMLGAMSVQTVDFKGSNGGLFGLYILGGYDTLGASPAIAPFILNDVQVSGTYTSAGISFLGYKDLAAVSMTDVVFNTSIPTALRGHLRLSGIGGTLDLGNTAFVSTNPQLDILLNNNWGVFGSQSTVSVDATKATFAGSKGSQMSLTQLFTVEDRIRHGLDNTTDAPGFVRVRSANVFVTANSGSILRGQTVATVGDTVHVSAGSFPGRLDITKRLIFRGANAGVAGCSPARGAETSIVAAADTAVMVRVANASVDGFSLTGAIGAYSLGFSSRFTHNKVEADIAGFFVNTVSSGFLIEKNCIELTTQMSGIMPSTGILFLGISGTDRALLKDNDIRDAYYGFFLYSMNSSTRSSVQGGTISGVMQGVAVSNSYPATTSVYAPSTLDISDITIHSFAGDHSAAPLINFHAGVYTFSAGADTLHKLRVDIARVHVSGTGKPSAPSAGMYFADFSTGTAKRQLISVTECIINNNRNRGINARGGNATLTVQRSTLSGNGFDAFGTGGNDGFGVFCFSGAQINLEHSFVVNPTSVTASVPAYALGAGTTSASVINAHYNSLDNNGLTTGGLVLNTGTIQATCNWWATGDYNALPSLFNGLPLANYIPLLINGTDADPATPGFQPAPMACLGGPVRVYSDANENAQISAHPTIQDAIDAPATLDGYVVRVDPGTFNESLLIDKALTFRGSNDGTNPVSGTHGPASTISSTGNLAVDIRHDDVTLDGFAITSTNGIALMANVAGAGGSLSDITVKNNVVNAKSILECPTCVDYLGVLELGGLSSSGRSASNIQFTNNLVTVQGTNGIGIRMNATNGATLSGTNKIQGNRLLGTTTTASEKGILLSSSKLSGTNPIHATISDNEVGRWKVGMSFQGDAVPTVNGNTFLSGSDVNTEDIILDTENGTVALGANIYNGSISALHNLSAFNYDLSSTTGNSFRGVAVNGSTTIAELYDIEDQIIHKVDHTDLGFIRLRQEEVFVTPDSYVSLSSGSANVQNAVLSARNGDIIRIKEGSTYSGNVDASASGLGVTLAPGSSPACVKSTGDFKLNKDDTLQIELISSTPCTGHDQIQIASGVVTLFGMPVLELSADPSFSPLPSDRIRIIDNQGANPVFGKFAQGHLVTSGTLFFSINYEAGTGNDVVLALAPTITCPSNVQVNTAIGTCSATVNSIAPSAFTGWDVTISHTISGAVSVSNGDNDASGTVFGKGLSTVTYTATDVVGNTNQCSFTVTVTDNETPTVSAGSAITSTTAADGKGNCTVAIAVGNATFDDNCPGETLAWVITGASTGNGNGQVGTFTFAEGISTITYTVTDAVGNSATSSKTVTVTDDEPPLVTCPLNQTRSTNAGLFTYTTVGSEFNLVSRSDNCGVDAVEYTLSGATTGTGLNSVAGVVLQFGLTTVTWKVTDVNGNTSTCALSVDVSDITTITGLTITPTSRQYSDKVVFEATVAPWGSPSGSTMGLSEGQVQFLIGSFVLGSAPVGAGGKATLDAALLEGGLDFANYNNGIRTNGPLKPGIKDVTAKFVPTNPEFLASEITAPNALTITRENAVVAVDLTDSYFTTASPTNCTGTVFFRANATDTNDGPDSRGDIRNTIIQLRDGITGTGTLLGPELTVGLFDPNDPTYGQAAYSTQYTLNNTECTSTGGRSWVVWADANNYYEGNDRNNLNIVTLALPGSEFVTGGGHLIQINSGGQYAGTAGLRMNFGFNMKYNSSLKNLQGQITVIFRRVVSGVTRLYQIKSNSITSLSLTTDTNFRKAVMLTKATLTDITDPVSPISLGGNLNLRLEAWDHRIDNGGSQDRINVRLTNSSNQVLYASGIIGSTLQVQTINGGNINVRNSNTAPPPCALSTNLVSSGLTSSSATVSWTAPAGAIAYNLRYRPQGSSTWITENGLTLPSRTLTGLTAGTTYEWSVQTVCSSISSSDWATAVTFQTSPDCSAPTTGLSATNITFSSANLTWDAKSIATSYDLQYRKVGDPTWIDLFGVPTNSMTLSGLASATTYEWRARTLCSTTTGAWSTTSTFTTLSFCVVANLQVATITSTSASLSWNAASGASTYTLRYRVQGGTWVNVTGLLATTYNLTGLSGSTTYEWSVQPNCGNEVFGTAFTTLAACNVTNPLVSAITSTGATLSWTAAPGATSYEVKYQIKGGSTWTTISNITTTSRILTGLTANTSYVWTVKPNCGSEVSGPEFKTLAAPACEASNLAVTNITKSGAKLNWSGPAGATYIVRYKKASVGTWTTKSAGSSTTYIVSGLSRNTLYNWQIVTVCNGVTGLTVNGPNFTTTNSYSDPSTEFAGSNGSAGLSVSEASAEAWPNPGSGSFELRMNGFLEGDALIRVLDLNGRILYSQPYALEDGYGNLSISLSESVPGLHFIQILQGDRSITLRWMNQ